MKTHIKVNDTNHRKSVGIRIFEEKLDTSKEKWLETYASRILARWSQWQTPLGVAYAYTNQIKTDLCRFYDNPLKKMFIEATYQLGIDLLFLDCLT